MKRAKKAGRAQATSPSGMTGRDGAIDFAIREQQSKSSSEAALDSHIYRVIELVGTSEKGIDDAVREVAPVVWTDFPRR